MTNQTSQVWQNYFFFQGVLSLLCKLYLSMLTFIPYVISRTLIWLQQLPSIFLFEFFEIIWNLLSHHNNSSFIAVWIFLASVTYIFVSVNLISSKYHSPFSQFRIYHILQTISSMSEGNVIQADIMQVQKQGQLLKYCLSKFPGLQNKTQHSQLMKMQNKYQYFLRKFQKYQDQHGKYQDLFNNIQKAVDQSPQIIEQNRSIQFINKVMEDTFKNYNKLKQSVDQLKIQKIKVHDEMISLKKVLLNMKGEYFKLGRQEEQRIQRKNIDETIIKEKDNIKAMFKIRKNKNQKLKQFRIKPIELNRINLDISFAERKIISQLDAINHLKEQFLVSIGTTLNDYYKAKQRQLHLKEKSNKNIAKKKFNLRCRSHKKNLQDYNPDQEAFEVFRIANEYDKQLQTFLDIDEEEVLKMIVSKGKIDDMMQLIETEKRGLVQAYQINKQEKIIT